MKCVIGLGNIGPAYSNTRHNLGFAVLDAYASAHKQSFISKPKFKAEIAEIITQDQKIILAKPSTYYNLSGESAHAIATFYKIKPQDMLIVHDELALPFGTIRTRQGGSDAGNNGIKSINAHIGPETLRMRCGIYTPLRDSMNDADFVLSKFTRPEVAAFNQQLPRIFTIIDQFAAGSFVTTTL